MDGKPGWKIGGKNLLPQEKMRFLPVKPEPLHLNKFDDAHNLTPFLVHDLLTTQAARRLFIRLRAAY